MNRIKKFIIPLLIFVFSSLASYAQNDCIVAFLANDLSSSTGEFKTIVKQSEGFQAWQLLNKEKPALRTNIEELVLVSKNLEAIKSAGGYLKWKALQGAGNFLDDIYNAQKSIINTWKNNIATATNIRKGNFGEMASDAFLAEKNFQPLHTRLQNIDAPTRQGIDGVFKKGNEYFIVESKYHGTSTLSTLTDGTKQMSDAWITPRLLDAVGGNTSLRNQIANSYRRLLAEISPDGTVIYKELDGSASVIGVFTP